MKLVLIRTYHPRGTNGLLYMDGRPFCYTIELPWRNNEVQRSCIPEGCYPVIPRSSDKFNNHLLLTNVPDRDLILIHPANNAIKELQGCIAPVSTLTGQGNGLDSRKVFAPLVQLVYAAIKCHNPVTLTIRSTVAQQAGSAHKGGPVILSLQNTNTCQQLQAA
jgi:hypothetical protein